MDDQGGSHENRLRYRLEVLRAVRKACPMDKPIGARISAHDLFEGGTTIADSIARWRWQHEVGKDLITVSTGAVTAERRPQKSPPWRLAGSPASPTPIRSSPQGEQTFAPWRAANCSTLVFPATQPTSRDARTCAGQISIAAPMPRSCETSIDWWTHSKSERKSQLKK